MDRTRIHEGIRRMRLMDVLRRTQRSELSQMEAADLSGISERTFRRWRDRQEAMGEAGLADRRLVPSPRREPVAEIERMLGLYRGLYRSFTVKHFHQHLGKRHNYKLGFTVTKLHLHRAGLVQAATKRSAHRKERPRRPMVGMMLHQDASTHTWLPGDAGKHDLVVTMEDATNASYSAFLVDQQGTASSLRGVRDVVAKHGLFCSLYTDRGCHYFFTPEGGGAGRGRTSSRRRCGCMSIRTASWRCIGDRIGWPTTRRTALCFSRRHALLRGSPPAMRTEGAAWLSHWRRPAARPATHCIPLRSAMLGVVAGPQPWAMLAAVWPTSQSSEPGTSWHSRCGGLASASRKAH